MTRTTALVTRPGDLYYDQVSLLTQLGLMPLPSGA
jgi:hypothetical protein